MKWQVIFISTIVLVLMSFPTVWANEQTNGVSESQICTSTMASITPLMKSSSSGSKSSSSSSSSKTKIKTGDDDDETDATSTGGGFPWWILIFGGIALLVIIGVLVWYFFLRK